jgi:hypothetical protein
MDESQRRTSLRAMLYYYLLHNQTAALILA